MTTTKKTKGPKLTKFQQMLYDDLRALGGSAKAIATKLQRKKIKGKASPKSCPIAVYLAREYGEDDVDVSDTEVSVDGVSVEPPEAVVVFIEQFDNGKFPKLQA